MRDTMSTKISTDSSEGLSDFLASGNNSRATRVQTLLAKPASTLREKTPKSRRYIASSEADLNLSPGLIYLNKISSRVEEFKERKSAPPTQSNAEFNVNVT